jgi:hypothetical protein
VKKYYTFIATLIVFVIVVVSYQSVMSRGFKSDQNREADIRQLELDIETTAESLNHLPVKLSDVKLTGKLQGKLDDYTYTKTDYNKYKLCTNFVHEKKSPSNYSIMGSDLPNSSYHAKGNQCFEYTVSGVTKPGPIIYAGGYTTCAVGPKDQKYDVGDLSWDGYDATAKTITVHNLTQQQTFRWCGDPQVTTSSGTTVSLASIPKGAKVEIKVTSPGTANNVGMVDFGTPYVTSIVESGSAKPQ